jgi:hypothetical protein
MEAAAGPSTEQVLERAALVRQTNIRMLRDLRDLRDKEGMLRRQLLEDWLPSLQRQADAADAVRTDLAAVESRREQRDQATIGILSAVVPAGRRSGSGTAGLPGGGGGGSTDGGMSASEELRHVMREHTLLLRELALKHQKAARRPAADL